MSTPREEQMVSPPSRTASPSVRWPIEGLQIRGWLVLPGRHQLAGAVQHIVLITNVDLKIVLCADRLDKDRVSLAVHGLQHSPWSGERVVISRDLVVQDIRIGLVQVQSLLDDGLAILVHWYAASIEGPRILKIAGLDFEHVVAAVAIRVD